MPPNVNRLPIRASLLGRYADKIQGVLRCYDRLVLQGTRPGFCEPWHDKKTGRTFLKPDSGRCLHYYFYFLDTVWGLCYLRVPTWCPFRLQCYFNGHNYLAQ